MCIKSMSEHCLIKKNTPELRKKLEEAGLSVCICTTFEDLNDLNKRYLYREGQKILTPFGIETIKEIIRTHSKQRGYEWLILVEENGNQYTPFELNGIVVKELTLEQWNQIIE